MCFTRGGEENSPPSSPTFPASQGTRAEEKTLLPGPTCFCNIYIHNTPVQTAAYTAEAGRGVIYPKSCICSRFIFRSLAGRHCDQN